MNVPRSKMSSGKNEGRDMKYVVSFVPTIPMKWKICCQKTIVIGIGIRPKVHHDLVPKLLWSCSLINLRYWLSRSQIDFPKKTERDHQVVNNHYQWTRRSMKCDVL